MRQLILKFAREVLAEVVKRGGELVSPEIASKRLEICGVCDEAGKVEPIPFLKMDGCTLCGCPFSTKPHMKNVIDIKTLSLTVVDCPLKKWETIQ